MTVGPGRPVGQSGGAAFLELFGPGKMALQSLPLCSLIGLVARMAPLGRQMLWPSLCLP